MKKYEMEDVVDGGMFIHPSQDFPELFDSFEWGDHQVADELENAGILTGDIEVQSDSIYIKNVNQALLDKLNGHIAEKANKQV